MARQKKPEGRCPALAVDSGDQPVWLNLRESIRAAIVAGQWQAGDALMPTRQMCAKLGLNRVTIDLAIRDLIREGLLYSKHGSGTFVADLRPPTVRILSFAREGAPAGWLEYRHCEAVARRELEAANIRTTAVYRGRTKAEGMHGPLMDRVLAEPADAYLTIGIQEDGYMSELAAVGRPVVAIDASPLSVAFDAVVFDTFRAGFLLGKYLLSQKHAAILFVGHDRLAAPSNPAGKLRIPEPDSERNLAGLNYALRSFAEPPVPVKYYEYWPDGGSREAEFEADLASGRYTSVVMTTGDAQRLRATGLRTDQLEIVLVNAAPNDPAVATYPRIELDLTPVAEQAAKRLVERLTRRSGESAPAPGSSLQILVEPTFRPGVPVPAPS